MSRPDKFNKLRKRAEELITEHQEEPSELSATEIKKLLHELETYQIELELQNTELSERQKELEISRNEYSELFDFAPVGYLIISQGGTILKANLAGAELFGLERYYLIKMNFFHFIHPDFRQTYFSYQKELLSTRTPLTCELKLHRKESASFYAILKGVAAQDADGKFNNIQIAVINIEDRKQAENALEKSEKKYRLLFENINEGIWRLDQNDQIDFVNSSIAGMLGYTKDEMLGKHVFSFTDEDGIAIAKQKLKERRTGIREQYIFEFLKKDGTKVYTVLNANPLFNETGKYTGAIGFITDITEHRKMEELLQASEARYRTVVELQTEMICRFLPDMTFSFVNRTYCQYFGKKEEELIGHCFLEFIPEKEHKKILDFFASFTSEEYVKEHEHTVKLPDGGIRWLYWSNRAIFDSENHIVAFQSVGRDITKRKKAEEGKRKFEFIADSSKDFMTLINRDYVYEAANRTYLKYINKSRKDIVGRTVFEVWGNDIFETHIRPNLDRCFTGEAVHFAGWIEFHKKGRGYYDVSYYPYVNEQGDVTHAAVFSLDHTEQKLAEYGRMESDERFRNAFDYAPIGMSLVSPDGYFLTVNQSLCRMFGYTEKEIIGKSFQEITHPDDMDISLKCSEDLLSGRRDYTRMEKRYIHKEGHPVWTFLSTSLIRDSDGKALYFVSQIQDITQRKHAEESLRKSEQQLSSMLHAIGDHIVMIDRELNVIWANEIAKEKFGHDILGKKCYEVYHKNKMTCTLFNCPVFKTFQDGKIHEGDSRIKESSGKTTYFHFTANVALKDDKGNAVTAIKIVRDITDRKIAENNLTQAYETLKNTQSQLIQSAKLASIGELAAGVAHELNQPLTVIRSNSQLMLQTLHKNDRTDQKWRERLEMIEKHTGRMMTIINHLRIFSHQSSAKFEDLHINNVIEESFLIINEQLRTHGITVKKNLAPKLPKIHGNAIQLEQVFLNLFTNARDAIEDKRAVKGTDSEISASFKDFLEIITRVSKDKKIEILIKDSGCGMLKDQTDKIFDPFFTTKEVGKGTGLGLSISYGIIKDHGGDIEVLETGENGTTFKITIPVYLK